MMKHIVCGLLILTSMNSCTQSNTANTGNDTVAASTQNDSVTFLINGDTVSQKKFEALLSTLKEVSGTWYCAETRGGGITGYDATDKKGKEYIIKFEVDAGITRQNIIRKPDLE